MSCISRQERTEAVVFVISRCCGVAPIEAASNYASRKHTHILAENLGNLSLKKEQTLSNVNVLHAHENPNLHCMVHIVNCPGQRRRATKLIQKQLDFPTPINQPQEFKVMNVLKYFILASDQLKVRRANSSRNMLWCVLLSVRIAFALTTEDSTAS